MVCKKCNAQLPDDVRFCSYCGEKVEAETVQTETSEENKETTQQEQAEASEQVNEEAQKMQEEVSEEAKEQTQEQQETKAEPTQENLQQSVVAGNETTNNNEEPKNSSTQKKFLIGGGVVLAIAIVVIAGWSLLKGKDNTQTTDTKMAQSKNGQVAEATEAPTEVPTEAPTPTPISFEDKILKLNESGNAMEEIDIYEENYSVKEAKEGDYWDKRMFESLEGTGDKVKEPAVLNTYTKEAKILRNKETGNDIEYILYRNPETNKVNKIVSIEVLESGEIETVDYYFTDEGKVDFIFFHTVTEYTPSYATQDKPGERYYFDEDAMTKWRIVTEESGKIKKHTYVVTKKELEGYEKEKTWSMLQDASSEIQDEFNEKAIRMLNAAYNTYYAVVDTESINLVDGYVINEEDEVVAGAAVRLFAEGKEDCLFETFTDEDGRYELYIPSDVYTYRLEIEAQDYLAEVIYGIEPTGEIVELVQENVCLFQDAEGGSMYFCLRHAFKDIYLSEATINIRKGINNRSGEIYDTLYYDEDENTEIVLEPGNYTLEIEIDKYQTAYKNIRFSWEDCITILLSPDLEEGEVRIVLDWGDYPEDLDAHLFTPYNRENSEDVYHIWYGNKTDPYTNNLDYDEMYGYGPETMTIKNLGDGCYKYYVADFDHCIQDDPTSYAMSESGAQVNVYTWKGEVETFYVPTNRSGVIWEVFEIRNGKINRINHYYSQIEDKKWWKQEK